MKDNKTEELIKERAKVLYFSIGKLDATTQEIADFAGVKRTLVNYYFGSKHELFEILLDELRLAVHHLVRIIIITKDTVYQKVAQIVDQFSIFMENHPFYNIFLINEINQCSEQKKKRNYKRALPELVDFFKELEAEMEKGNIPKMDPLNLYINIFALVSYPILMRPYYNEIFDVNQVKMDSIFADRKNVILNSIFINSTK